MMVWPFGSSRSSDKAKDENNSSVNGPTSWNDLMPQPDPPLHAATQWLPVFLSAVGSVAAFRFYQTRLKRFSGPGSIQDSSFRRRTLFGKVTSVGDGDGFHLYHTPGGRLAGWGWLRNVPESRADLKGNTIPIRLAGVDAPEGAHFGRPGQPFATEAMDSLTDSILHRRVRVRIWKRDQYNRVVATVHVRRFLFRQDVGLELLKKGLATTYEAKSGVEWGGQETVYKAAQAKAKSKKVGIWSGKSSDFESPREYKARSSDPEATAGTKKATIEKKSWWRRWLFG